MAQSYQFKYELIYDKQTNQSIFKLDTLIIDKPKELSDMNYMVNSNLNYVIQDSLSNYKKNEIIFDRKFFAYGKSSNIEWEITGDKKVISGINCRKAVPKNKSFLLNVWYAEEINIPTGPSTYFGLPGLVIFAEDFFLTIEAVSVQSVDYGKFTEEFEKYSTLYNENKGDDEIDDRILQEKKNKLIKSMIDQMNSKK